MIVKKKQMHYNVNSCFYKARIQNGMVGERTKTFVAYKNVRSNFLLSTHTKNSRIYFECAFFAKIHARDVVSQ